MPSPVFSFPLFSRPPRSTLFPYTTLFRFTLSISIFDRPTPRYLVAGAPSHFTTHLDLATLRLHLFRTRFPHRSEEHTSEPQSLTNLVCRLLLAKKKRIPKNKHEYLHWIPT